MHGTGRGPMALYPRVAALSRREVLVGGGGEVAARKIAALLRAGAAVRVHAHAIEHPDIAAALDAGRLVRLSGDFDPAWLDAVWLVVAATDDAAFNAGLAAEAGRRRRLVNVVDDAVLSTFQVPAVVDRSPLVVAISSAGAAPMLARRVRERLETLLDPGLGVLAGLFGRHRERIREALPDLAMRRRWFERMLDGRLEAAHAAAGTEGVEASFLHELRAAADGLPATGWVALLPASGDPDLYTLRGLRALNEADAILLAPGLDDAVLEPARRDAHRYRLEAGQAAAHALKLAAEGARVVYLHTMSGGTDAADTPDAVQRACADARIACNRIPGVQAGAAPSR